VASHAFHLGEHTIINIDPSAATRKTLFNYTADPDTRDAFPWLISPAPGRVFGVSTRTSGAMSIDVFDTLPSGNPDGPWSLLTRLPLPTGGRVIGITASTAAGLDIIYTIDYRTLTLANIANWKVNTTMQTVGTYTGASGIKFNPGGNCITAGPELTIVCSVSTPSSSKASSQVLTVTRNGEFKFTIVPALMMVESVTADSSFVYVAGIDENQFAAVGVFSIATDQWRPMVNWDASFAMSIFGCVRMPGQGDDTGFVCLGQKYDSDRVKQTFLLVFDPVEGVARKPIATAGTVVDGLGLGYLSTY
jgi:hypothetical protein